MKLSKKILAKAYKFKQRKSVKQYSRSHNYRLKKARISACREALEFLEVDGILPISVTVKHGSGSLEEIGLNINYRKSEGSYSSTSLDVEQFLYIKERFNVSHGAYHELAMVCKNLPRRCQMQAAINDMNNKFEMKPICGGFVGFQQSIQ